MLLRIYERLLRRYGHAGWWPGSSALEVAVGAILAQNTSWSNVEKALLSLKRRRKLSYRALRAVPPSRIGPWIRSSGTYRNKARTLAGFLAFLEREYRGSLRAMAREEPGELRRRLLALTGIGPETADSIVLYVASGPLFVVDAYTRRLFTRLGVLAGGEDYDEIQRVFMRKLPPDASLYGDFHAQIVRLAKDACRTRPRCDECPLEDLCPRIGVAS